ILDETVDLRFEADAVTLRTGVQAMGQGHLSTYPRLIAARLGVDPSAVRLIQGDSDEVPVGTPSVASRSLMMAGSAAVLACDAAVDDVGRLAHPVIVEGQIHGGVAQGLGQVLGEQVVYGETGQLLTASFMDYMLPRAEDLPDLRVGHHVVPCTTNPLGVKGAG